MSPDSTIDLPARQFLDSNTAGYDQKHTVLHRKEGFARPEDRQEFKGSSGGFGSVVIGLQSEPSGASHLLHIAGDSLCNELHGLVPGPERRSGLTFAPTILEGGLRAKVHDSSTSGNPGYTYLFSARGMSRGRGEA